MLILCSDLVGVTGFELAHPASRTRFGLFDTERTQQTSVKIQWVTVQQNAATCSNVPQFLNLLPHKWRTKVHSICITSAG
jgi:hypothetical protein